MKDITMNKIIHTFQIILLLGLIAAQPLNAQLRIPASHTPRGNLENEENYHIRLQQIKSCRDQAQQYLSQPPNSGGKHFGSNYNRYAMHNRGPLIPSKQNCVNALWYLRRASDLGDFESAQILGDVYSTGRLLGHHAIQAFPDEAAKYRVRTLSIAQNAVWDGWRKNNLPQSVQRVTLLAKNGNLSAHKAVSNHPRVMHAAAVLARRQGESLRAINLAEEAHRNLAPNAQASIEVFIASIRMELAKAAEWNRNYQRAIFHAEQAGKFNDPQAKGYIENMEFKAAADANMRIKMSKLVPRGLVFYIRSHLGFEASDAAGGLRPRTVNAMIREFGEPDKNLAIGGGRHIMMWTRHTFVDQETGKRYRNLYIPLNESGTHARFGMVFLR